jgi:ATP-binding cassette subfamily F protein 3
MATGSIAHFSGGEKARLALALIVWQRPNLLLLDEPTNHLDLETREALTVALAQFEGTLVLVSHDRHLLRATTDQFLIIADGRLRPFDGDLDDYRDWLLKSKLEKPAQSPAAPLPAAAPPGKAPAPTLSAASRKSLEARVKRLEDMISRLSARKAVIEAQLADPGIYEPTARETLQAALTDQAYVGKELSQLEAEWLEKQAALDHPK